MSDLLAPLLVVMETEVDTFWCFVGFMDMVVSTVWPETFTGENFREFRCMASFRESFIREFLYVRAHAWGSFGSPRRFYLQIVLLHPIRESFHP